MTCFKTIGLVRRSEEPSVVDSVIKLTESILREHDCEAILVTTQSSAGEETQEMIEKHLKGCDLIIVFGGDGTFLGIARKAHHLNVPFLGVNLGRLGFLADINERQLRKSLSAILRGEYTLESRELLNTWIGDHVSAYALNDVVIHQRNISRMIELDVFVNEQYLTSYWADGVIFATPTGSTAYALSSGGPLIYPTLSAILIVPICPHTFSHRPIVLPSDSAIQIVLKEGVEKNVNVSCDGQVSFPFYLGETLNIVCNSNKIDLIHPLKYSYFDILRAKLNWGQRPIRER